MCFRRNGIRMRYEKDELGTRVMVWAIGVFCGMIFKTLIVWAEAQ